MITESMAQNVSFVDKSCWNSFARSGVLDPSRNARDQRRQPYTARRLLEADVDEVFALHQLARSLSPRPELVRPDTRDYFLRHMEDEGFILGAFVGGALVGYGLASLPHSLEDSYGPVLGLPDAEFPLIGQLEGAAVHPDWWGHHLHFNLATWRIECLAAAGYKHIGATVAPRNTWSLRNLLSVGMTVRVVAEMYGGLLRYVVLWEGAERPPPAPTSGPDTLRRLPLNAIAEQTVLLHQGWRGIALEAVPPEQGGDWAMVLYNSHAAAGGPAG